jgi:4-aminobutyrate aminotransferase
VTICYPDIVVKPPGPRAREIVERDHAVIYPSFGRFYPLVIKSGKGYIITDVDGKEYIDLNACLAVCNVGHSHPGSSRPSRSRQTDAR